MKSIWWIRRDLRLTDNPAANNGGWQWTAGTGTGATSLQSDQIHL